MGQEEKQMGCEIAKVQQKVKELNYSHPKLWSEHNLTGGKNYEL